MLRMGKNLTMEERLTRVEEVMLDVIITLFIFKDLT